MSPTLTPPVPVVLIGIHTEIGSPVAERLRPDWDIVRFIQSFEAAKADLPHLISGREPPNPPTNSVGSGMSKYGGRPVRAVLLGRGFSQQQAEELYELYGGNATEPIVWAAGSEAKRPKGLLNDGPPPGVANMVVPIFKSVLENWKGQGASKGELVLY
ncbi:hypothetical protein HD806DRAFT_531894 [Xylariaceae sp. AK1471]|nr:hypothetical protein HD806DRAFT_531894 [Xylariaceae sp. AK1471]